jgi:hypothetical protein
MMLNRIPCYPPECTDCIDVQQRGCDGECRDCYNERITKEYEHNLTQPNVDIKELWLDYFLPFKD